MKKYLVALSLALNLIVLVSATIVVEKKGGLPWLNRKIAEVLHKTSAADYKNNKLSVYDQLPIGQNDIVFLGDSILDFGEWHELLNDGRIKNRSINGDDTHGILARLDKIVAGRPRRVVMLCGINNFQKRIPHGQTVDEYAKIIDVISSRSPGTDIWLLPTLPVNERLYRQWIVPDHPGINMPKQSEVRELNIFVRSLAEGRSRVHFVDMPSMVNTSGELREEFTGDGLHLNGSGLKEISACLRRSEGWQ